MKSLEHRRAKRALQSLNFFMADMQAGVGPFLGVFLLAHGWQSGAIGSVMTIGGVAGVLMTTPAGAWVDSSQHKRWLVAIPGICTVFASAVILLWQTFWPVALSQVATAIAGALIGPAVAGITLGMFRQSGFTRQTGVNQAYNHAGNAVGAGLSGLLGWKFGLPAVFYLAVIFALASIISVFAIRRESIDDRVARGLRSHGASGDTASGISVLLRSRPLLVLAASLALFHLGNAAMLPLYGLAVVAARQGDPAAFVAATIVVAQATMVFTALIAMRMSEKQGLWLVMLISYAALPIRGLIAAHLIKSWGVFPVQILDGVGAGLQSVAPVPGTPEACLSGPFWLTRNSAVCSCLVRATTGDATLNCCPVCKKTAMGIWSDSGTVSLARARHWRGSCTLSYTLTLVGTYSSGSNSSALSSAASGAWTVYGNSKVSEI